MTGYKKREFSLDRKQLSEDLARNYQTYKGLSMYPVFMNAYSHLYAKEYWHCKSCVSDMRVIRIYIDTPAFDRIIKDKGLKGYYHYYLLLEFLCHLILVLQSVLLFVMSIFPLVSRILTNKGFILTD